MRLLKWGTRMAPNKYNLVLNDDSDARVPLHPEEAFTAGITFHAKYIGTMDVPRPTSRVEIVAAMRRIRYEFKAKGVKKKKVTVEVSVDGVRVSVRKKKVAKKKEGSKLFGGHSTGGGEPRMRSQELLHHPIYRIFYVSHDSSDLKIFSYIARDGATNLFKCNVFKSNKKSQAMRIVRTVGQAFDVCHKLSSSPEPPASTSASVTDEPAASAVSEVASEPPVSREAVSECGASSSSEAAGAVASTSGAGCRAERPQKLELLPPPPRKEGRRSPSRSVATPSPSPTVPEPPEPTGTPGAQHELQLLRERLSQQSQQTRAAVAQLLLLRDQLAAEQAARCEAQARTHQLLVHNKELLDHITALVAHLQERERGARCPPISVQQLTAVPQMNATTPQESSGLVLGNRSSPDNGAILDLLSHTSYATSQNLQNNNVPFQPFVSPLRASTPINGQNNNNTFPYASTDQFIAQFQTMGGYPQSVESLNCNQQFYQNCNAFPSIPPLANRYSSVDLASWLPQSQVFAGVSAPTQLGQSPLSSEPSQSSLLTPSPSPGSDDGVEFIRPLSQAATVAATDASGRLRLFVPVSPSGSAGDIAGEGERAPVTLSVTDERGVTRRALPAAAPVITRTTSEKVPNRSEMMTTMRAQWTRHTTK